MQKKEMNQGSKATGSFSTTTMKQWEELALPEKYEQATSIMQSKSVKDLTYVTSWCNTLRQSHAHCLHQYHTFNAQMLILTQPHEWFSSELQGHILHCQNNHASLPVQTNSGKTHQSLDAIGTI